MLRSITKNRENESCYVQNEAGFTNPQSIQRCPTDIQSRLLASGHRT